MKYGGGGLEVLVPKGMEVQVLFAATLQVLVLQGFT